MDPLVCAADGASYLAGCAKDFKTSAEASRITAEWMPRATASMRSRRPTTRLAFVDSRAAEQVYVPSQTVACGIVASFDNHADMMHYATGQTGRVPGTSGQKVRSAETGD